MIENKKSPRLFLSPESAALKRRLRSLRWQPEAVMREIHLIQKLRVLVAGEVMAGNFPEDSGYSTRQ